MNIFFVSKNRIYVKSRRMEELKKFQSSTFDTIARRRLVEDHDTILELTGKIQVFQNEFVWMIQKDFQDACINSQWKYQSTSVIPTSSSSWRNAKPFYWNVEPQRRAAKHIWDTWYIGKLVNPDAPSSAPYPQELNLWNSSIEEAFHSSKVEKSKRQEQNQDLRCQTGPSAKDSVIPCGGDSSKSYGADQKRLQISDLHFDNTSLHQPRFACWKLRFKTEVCTCSQFPTEAMQWIQRSGVGWFSGWIVDLRHLLVVFQCRILKYSMRGLPQHWTKSSIILLLKRRISLEEQRAQKEDRFLRGRQIAYLIYEYFGSLEPRFCRKTMPTYLQLFFEVMKFRNSIRSGTEFYCLWRKSQLMTIFEGLYKLRIRESDKLKTVLELYDLEIHEKKIGPDYHRWNLWWREVSSRIYKRKILAPEMEIKRGNAVVKIRGHNSVDRIFGDCWQWKANGQCCERRQLQFPPLMLISVHEWHSRIRLPSSFMSRNDKNSVENPKFQRKSPSGWMSRRPCKDYSKTNLQ